MLPRVVCHGRPSSVNVQKALWALEEAAVDFTLTHASRMLGPGASQYSEANPHPRTGDAEYREMSPTGLIPALELHGEQTFTLHESSAIVRYVSRKFKPELLGDGSAEALATAEKWMDWVISSPVSKVQPIIDHTIRFDPAKRDPVYLQTYMVSYSELLSVADAQLQRSAFLAGPAFTIADIPLGALVCRFMVALEVAAERGTPLDVPALPGIHAWFQRLLQRPAFVRGVYVPERLHVGLPVSDELPKWHSEYLAAALRHA